MTIPATLQDWLTAGAGAGLGGGIAVYFCKVIVDLIAGRLDRREASVENARTQVDAATKILVDNLQTQITALTEWRAQAEEALAECRKQHAAAQEEIAKLRGASQGLGDAKQQAAANLAADRIMDRRVAQIGEKAKEVKE